MPEGISIPSAISSFGNEKVIYIVVIVEIGELSSGMQWRMNAGLDSVESRRISLQIPLPASQPALRRFGRGGLCRGRDAGVAWRGNEKVILWRVHLPTTRYTFTTATDNRYDVKQHILYRSS